MLTPAFHFKILEQFVEIFDNQSMIFIQNISQFNENDKVELFPSPERIDKVKLSMENIETVVRERNRAYHLLETGKDGERPQKLVYNQLGLRFMYR